VPTRVSGDTSPLGVLSEIIDRKHPNMSATDVQELAAAIVEATGLHVVIEDVKGPQFRGPIRIWSWKTPWREC